MNLTSITDPEQIVIKHYLDSLTLYSILPELNNVRLIDIGTGAGFPGLAMAIAFPGLQVTLLDSTAKKLRFVEHVGIKLELANIQTLHARAEDAGNDHLHRESYDVVTARAVAKLPVLLEYTLPLARLGGQVIAMAGKSAYAEANSAAHAIETLGGELFSIERIQLPTLDNPRFLIVVDKIDETPPRYPRAAGIPARDPIH